MAKKSKILKVADAWAIATNPLRNLNSNQIDRLLSDARSGHDIRLQVAFAEMERQTPIFAVCIQKRLAGITNRQWRITPIGDTPEAQSQAEKIQAMFEKSDTLNETGLTEALRHLGMAAFRGRSCVKPFIDENGLHFRKLDNWNVLRKNNKLYWCPTLETYDFDFDDKQLIPETEVCYVANELPVDVPGMQIYIRQLVGEETWARFLEKQGIPQILITAPEGTPDDELATWSNRAMQIFEGGSGVLPNGSSINVLDSARSADPFTSFIQHQMELISILATGGNLSTLGGATGLGSNLADVQNQDFQNLINADCKKIANAMTNIVVRKCALSLGQAPLSKFEFVEADDIKPQDYLDMAIKLQGMGVTIDVVELKRLTGLSFIKDDIDEAWTPVSDDTEGED